MRNRCTDFKRLLEWFMLCLCSAFIVTLQLEMSFSTRISWPWYLTLVCHVMYTKVVNTKRCLGYVIKTYLRIRLQRCITIGYGNNWVTSIPAPCFCEYRAWTRVRWNVVAIVGNMARHFSTEETHWKWTRNIFIAASGFSTKIWLILGVISMVYMSKEKSKLLSF